MMPYRLPPSQWMVFFYSVAWLLGIFVLVRADAAPEVRFHGFAELRLAWTDEATNWLDQGLGKARYGGEADAAQGVVDLAELSLLVLPRWDSQLSGVIQLQYQPEQGQPLDIIAAHLRYRGTLGNDSRWQWRSRWGLFFPPVSFEHQGLGWQNAYHLSASAINSWVAEELRTLGGELTLQYGGETGEVALTYALLGGNDPTGTILAWRGWALHDLKAGWYGKLPLSLAALPELKPGGIFYPQQALVVEPFHEVDGRLGYYAGLSGQGEHWKTRYLHYDNRADQTRLNHGSGQYAWHTRFNSIGAQWQWLDHWELIGQFLEGSSAMGRDAQGQGRVEIGFQSAYLLLSHAWGQHRGSIRHDWFKVDDRDQTLNDPNTEEGTAWTATYQFTRNPHQQFRLEYSWIESTRPARLIANQAATLQESLWQASYQFLF